MRQRQLGAGIAHTHTSARDGALSTPFRGPTLPREMHGDGAAKSNTDAGFGEWAGRPGTQRGCNWSARSVDRCEGSERGAVPVSILSVCGVRFRRYERMRGGHCDDSLSNQSMFCSKPAHCNEGSRTALMPTSTTCALPGQSHPTTGGAGGAHHGPPPTQTRTSLQRANTHTHTHSSTSVRLRSKAHRHEQGRPTFPGQHSASGVIILNVAVGVGTELL